MGAWAAEYHHYSVFIVITVGIVICYWVCGMLCLSVSLSLSLCLSVSLSLCLSVSLSLSLFLIEPRLIGDVGKEAQ